VVGIDLAEDKQAIAVTDHDVRVLAHKTVRVKAFRLGETVGQARAKGFTRVTMACEPTGSRWMQVQRLCAERGLPLVCIQPLISHIAREQQNYTTHKTDESPTPAGSDRLVGGVEDVLARDAMTQRRAEDLHPGIGLRNYGHPPVPPPGDRWFCPTVGICLPGSGPPPRTP